MKIFDTILLVDDDRIIIRLNTMFIKNEGLAAQVLQANNGIQALEIIQTNPAYEDGNNANLILLDINMPGMGGFEFLDKYIELGLDKKLDNTTIILSSSGRQEELKQADSYGIVEEYWIKPMKREKWMNLAARLQKQNNK